MTNSVRIKPLKKVNFNQYIEIGIKSYKQHYLDFWIDDNPAPYINDSFILKVLSQEFKDLNTLNFIIYLEELPVGILKVIIDKKVANYSKEESLLLEKIYILKEYAAQGIGSKILAFVEDFAKKKEKKVVWLDSMIKGKATAFYQKNGYKIISEKMLFTQQ